MKVRIRIARFIDVRHWKDIFKLRRRREQTKWMEPPYRWR